MVGCVRAVSDASGRKKLTHVMAGLKIAVACAPLLTRVLYFVVTWTTFTHPRMTNFCVVKAIVKALLLCVLAIDDAARMK